MPTEQNHSRLQQRRQRANRFPQRAGGGLLLKLRTGFTLVELLVTIVIIAILAGVVLSAAAAAQRAANVAHTQALIAKLHGQLMVRYESYRTRRLPINTAGLNGPQAAIHRLNAIRELMRMEMPDRYADLMTQNNALGIPYSPPMVATYFSYDSSNSQWVAGPVGGPPVYLQPTATNLSYQRRVASAIAAGTSPSLIAQYEDAECLYLILNTGLSDDSAVEQINSDDIGDADGDGMPEFHDAWGRPIRFIRWAPGFVSDLQPYDPVNSAKDPRFTAKSHDPFDPLKMQHPFDPSNRQKIDLQSAPAVINAADGMSLTPLIYSVGPDGVDGVQHPSPQPMNFAQPSSDWYCQFYIYMSLPSNYYSPAPPFKVYNPFAVTVNGVLVGAADPTDPDAGYSDSITNHLLGQQ